ncbi:hypothetical protein [Burkholderia cenocepacia]|uniref:hypothetical protein n=1 Tax=Burkholderia cenocepacia TaxID=95486 RepID=UPI001D12ADD5|nr:hypothetical protein [Burkholderia cenocepacia]
MRSASSNRSTLCSPANNSKRFYCSKAYLAIERAIGREVPQKQIVEELEKSGLRLSMGGFRSLLEAERKQRKETGERVRCERCGSNLPHVNDEGSQTNGPRKRQCKAGRAGIMFGHQWCR